MTPEELTMHFQESPEGQKYANRTISQTVPSDLAMGPANPLQSPEIIAAQDKLASLQASQAQAGDNSAIWDASIARQTETLDDLRGGIAQTTALPQTTDPFWGTIQPMGLSNVTALGRDGVIRTGNYLFTLDWMKTGRSPRQAKRWIPLTFYYSNSSRPRQ